MSQKGGKRTRKQTELHQVVVIPDEPEEKPETVKTIKEKIATNQDETFEKLNNGTEILSQSDDQAKDVKDISNNSECGTQKNDTQSSGTVEEKNLDQSKPEQTDSEGENLEPLVLEKETNGVQTVTEPHELAANGEGFIEDKKEDDEELKGFAIEERVTNGNTHTDGEGSKADEEEEVEKFEEVTDGKKSTYHLESLDKSPYADLETYSESFASTEAVAGSDTTRFEDNFEYSKFLITSKDQSMGQTLRHLSGRRTIRKSYFPVDANDRKRKIFDHADQESKRQKKESPGLMSYLGYPFKKSDVTSSTPKLTGYRENAFDNNVSNITLNDSQGKSANKWCSIM